jgi:flagellar protein FlgJ
MTAAAINPSIFDVNGLSALKRAAKTEDPAALKAAAQQFEALFLQMVLKSMRDATPKEGLFDSDQTRLYESLLDQQLGLAMAAKGGTGLAAVIERQLARDSRAGPAGYEEGLPLNPVALPHSLRSANKAWLLAPVSVDEPFPLPLPSTLPVAPVESGKGAMNGISSSARDFAAKLSPFAGEASRATGIPAEFLIAQAALETGWGRSEPRRADGQVSYNVFGIKAGRGWTGPTVEAITTEYIEGIAQQRVDSFRAYPSYREAFRDYAKLLTSNPRYAGVLGATDPAAFALGLQRAGYATDPAYAEKLARIITGPSLRVSALA